MRTSEVLNKAADLIEERGWVTDESGDGDPWGGGAGGAGPVCLEGGMLAALGLGVDQWGNPVKGFRECPAYAAVHEHIGIPPWSYLWTWNDASGRTAAEVIEALRACALIESAREEQDAAWETYSALVSV